MEYIVEKNEELLKYLYSKLSNISKNNIKSLLKNEHILVNDRVVTKFNYLLKEKDTIHIIDNYIKDYKNIEIIYEDKDLIVVNKPENLLTIATEKEKDRTLYNIVSKYVKSKNKNNKIYIIHRLDKDTSGIIMFAKNIKVKEELQKNWNDLVIRKYIALVSGNIKEDMTLKNYISINKINESYITNIQNGKLAITNIYVKKNYHNKTLLDIDIKTGRKNQIRLQLANINHSIIGDKKYGNIKAKRMYLHAYSLEFIHPITKKRLKLKTVYPQNFE
ncbi:MAG TPA: RluA family pseudouridine synthase [Bacilli bacterium]|nr:RluA family pseudouridine synthase [Bacilli bacterium]